jgi:exonuclease SbcC
MIPIELRLRNFLSYGEDVPPLDFTSFKLACLTGRNGHGKSAILDALTWAVWGEARKAGYSRSPDADLLRQNAGEMFVEFTFSLGGSEYQVYREYHSKRRTGKLEFRSRKNRDDAYILLTGNSKRDTQQRINQVLGLDYRTFVNSSFLQQGKADEFTRQPPKDRKEILCTILGLDFYDRLLDEAKLRLNAVRAERKMLDDSLASIQLELEEEESIAEREQSLSAAVQEKDNALEVLRSGIKEIREQIAGLQHVRERIERGQAEEIRIQKRLQEIAAREEKHQAEKKDSLAMIAREAEIETRYRRHEEIGKQLHDLLAVDERHDRLNTQRIALEKAIDEQRNLLQVQLASLKAKANKSKKPKRNAVPFSTPGSPLRNATPPFRKSLPNSNASWRKNRPTTHCKNRSPKPSSASNKNGSVSPNESPNARAPRKTSQNPPRNRSNPTRPRTKTGAAIRMPADSGTDANPGGGRAGKQPTPRTRPGRSRSMQTDSPGDARKDGIAAKRPDSRMPPLQ